ncbi:MAG: hypothetical protein ACE5KF_13050, partial [Kiloniellaceae bacterium]
MLSGEYRFSVFISAFAGRVPIAAGLPKGLSEMALLTPVIVFLGLLICWTIWRSQFVYRWRPTPASWRRISWLVLITKFAVGALFVEIREIGDLMTQGLSDANKARIVITLVAGAWVTLLVLTRRVTMPDLLSGPGYWISVLILLFAVSALWSVWAKFTLYHAFELACFWILAKHLFAQARWREQIATLCIMFLLFAWIKGLLYGGNRPTGMSSLLGFRSSGASAVAAILLIYEFVEIRSTETRNKAMHWWKASFAAISLIVFGSLTSQAGAVAGLSVVMVVSLDKKVQLVARRLLAAVALLAFTAWLSMPSFDLVKPLVSIANLFGRSESTVMSFTGRIPFWQGIWDIMKGEHFGLGFAAAERIIFIRLEGVLWDVGWATN